MIAADASDVQVVVTIVIEVPHSAAHPVSVDCKSGLGCYFAEGTVLIVVIEAARDLLPLCSGQSIELTM